MHHQYEGGRSQQTHRAKILHRIVVELLVKPHRNRIGDIELIESVSIGGRGRSEFPRNIAACSRAIIDDDRLAPFVGELLAQHTPYHIGATARRKRHDEAHRPHRKRGLRALRKYALRKQHGKRRDDEVAPHAGDGNHQPIL